MISAAAFSQSIRVAAPASVRCGENFRVEYVIDTQDVSDFRSGIQTTEGYEVIAGPYESRSSSYHMVNGHTSSSSTLKITYTLYALKEGDYTFPAARATIGGKSVSAKPFSIKISGKAPSGSGAPKMHGEDNSADNSPASISPSSLFIKVSANRQRVKEQEAVLVTYKVYTLVELTQLEGKMPDLKDCHVQEVELPQQKSFHIENVGGKNYRCVTWSQYVVYPQRAGTVEIPSIKFKGIVVVQNKNVDPLEAFLNGGAGYTELKREIVAPSVKIAVEELPDKPADFSGGVGKMKIKASVDKNAVNVMLDPGLAFGTGTHPTTAMCLEYLDGFDIKGRTVIDYGCGSGILAIAALKLGAGKVIGIDIDPQAIQASRDNAERNGVSENFELYLVDERPAGLQADLVVANILAGPLRELAPLLSTLVKDHGHIALSGILETQAQEINGIYGQWFDMTAPNIREEWCQLSGIKK